MNEDNVSLSSSDLANMDELTRKLIQWYRLDIDHTVEWRREAREDFQFFAGSGGQWSEEDRNALRAQGRPVMEFNRVAPLVNAVVGSEINNRREVRYIPREQGDAIANELLTAAGEWFRDETNAEDEESEGFSDCVKGGMGWIDTRLDYEAEPDGAPKMSRMNPFKMVWDSTAQKPNLEDSQRFFYVDQKPWAEAKDMFPDADEDDLDATWVNSDADIDGPHDQTRADRYEGGQNPRNGVSPRRMCTIVECRWLERKPYYRGPDIENTGEMRNYDEKQVTLIKKQIPDFKAVRQYKKVVKRAFIGKKVLGEVDSPAVPDGLFGWECITGFHDEVKNQFYGIIRPTKDPQRWSNKYFSQVMYILNSKAKGGILAERGAFDDDRQAEDSWAKQDAITWLKPGSLSGQSPRVQNKPESSFPAGFWTLFQESKEAINQVTGLSPEFVGTREVDQAGVLEYQRRQSSLSLLAPLFNSLRRYRKRQGRVMLYLIQNFLSDGRLIRIVGKGKEQYVPLTKPENASIEYDIIVDDAPTSPNEKERTWSILQSLLPLVKDYMTPDIAMAMLEYTPLPPSFVAKIKEAAEAQAAQAAQQPPPPNSDEIKTQAMAQQAEIKNQGEMMKLQNQQASAEIQHQKDGIDLYIEQQKAALETQQNQAKLELQNQSNAIAAEKNRIAAERLALQQVKERNKAAEE